MLVDLYVRFISWWNEQKEGQDLVEYALLLALIALLLIVALTAGKNAISTVWSSIVSALSGA